MNAAALFIRRPVATTLLVLSILIFGVMGYRLLPVSDLPTVDFPTIQVSASLPGASPNTMASTVATPLERQFQTIAGVTAMSSSYCRIAKVLFFIFIVLFLLSLIFGRSSTRTDL